MTSGKPRPRASVESSRDFSEFGAINAWVFDLDNTLYPRSTNLHDQVDRRIRDYVARLLNIGPEDAETLRRDYYQRFGTTLRGLIQEYDVRPDDFLEYVHDIDHSTVPPDPLLASQIASLPGRKFILTNGSRRHAERVAERLGFTDEFEDIFDIVRSDLIPKPNRETYDRFVATTGVRPNEAAMFEDLSRNLVVPKALGMKTILVVPERSGEGLHEDWEVEGRDAAHIDFVTDDLHTFLGEVLAEIGARP